LAANSARVRAALFPAQYNIAEHVTSDPYAIAARGESTRLLKAINANLAGMKQDGTLQQIVDEWMKK